MRRLMNVLMAIWICMAAAMLVLPQSGCTKTQDGKNTKNGGTSDNGKTGEDDNKSKTLEVGLRIARYKDAELTNADADRILADMTEVLRAKDGPDDVECDIRFVRNGDVAVFDVGDGSIDTPTEWNDLLNKVDADVLVVNFIKWCGSPGSSIIGCAPTPGDKLVVVRFDADQEGILWAHEFGHNKGRPHRNSTDVVMRDFIGSTHKMINQPEHDAYLLTTSPAVSPAVQPAQKKQGEKVDVKTFVHRRYIHGVPWDEAAKYGEQDVPILLEMLKNPEEAPFHANIVTTLGLIGDKRAVQPMIELIAKGTDRLTVPQYQAREAAVLHLGTLYNKTKDETALNYLLESVMKPSIWTKRVKWQPPTAVKADVSDEMNTMALWGLALSGAPQAQKALQSLKEGGGGLSPAVRPIVNDALQTFENVSRQGLIEYFHERHGNTHQPAVKKK